MPLQALGFIELPAHVGDGGFDHAAVHPATGHVYVAHTANDALDVLDVEKQRYVGSIGGLTAVAGALVAEPDTVFTSNRGENTVGIMRVGQSGPVEKVAVGLRPNGLAYDGGRNRLMAAHVGDPGVAGSRTVSIVDVPTRTRVADVPVAEDALSAALGRLFAVAEAYPDLKASASFTQLQTQLAEIEGDIAVSRQVYNDTVLTYRNAIESVPTNVLAGIFKFGPKQYFEIDELAAGEPVRVQF